MMTNTTVESMVNAPRCKCGHLQSDHFLGPDPDHAHNEAEYCDHEGCMCWERDPYMPPAAPLTPDRKPGRQA